MRGIWLPLLSLMLLPGCDEPRASGSKPAPTGEEVRREVGEAVETTGEYAAQKRDEYARELRRRLKEYEPQIEQMRERIREAGDDARPRLERQLERMRERRDALVREIERVERAGAAAWEQFRDGAERAWDAFRRSLDDPESPPAETPDAEPPAADPPPAAPDGETSTD